MNITPRAWRYADSSHLAGHVPRSNENAARGKRRIMEEMNTSSEGLESGSKQRERVTWRLDPSNYDFVNRQRKRLRLTSMNAALNVILAEHRERCGDASK